MIQNLIRTFKSTFSPISASIKRIPSKESPSPSCHNQLFPVAETQCFFFSELCAFSQLFIFKVQIFTYSPKKSSIERLTCTMPSFIIRKAHLLQLSPQVQIFVFWFFYQQCKQHATKKILGLSTYCQTHYLLFMSSHFRFSEIKFQKLSLKLWF